MFAISGLLCTVYPKNYLKQKFETFYKSSAHFLCSTSIVFTPCVAVMRFVQVEVKRDQIFTILPRKITLAIYLSILLFYLFNLLLYNIQLYIENNTRTFFINSFRPSGRNAMLEIRSIHEGLLVQMESLNKAIKVSATVPHLQTQLQDGSVLPSPDPFLIFPSHLSPSPVHATRFSFCFFPGILAIFILLPSNKNNNQIEKTTTISFCRFSALW